MNIQVLPSLQILQPFLNPCQQSQEYSNTDVFQLEDSILNPMFSSNNKTQSNVHGNNVVDNSKAILMDVPTSKHSKIDQCGLNLKKVSSNLPTCTCNISYENKLLTINIIRHLLVIEVNNLLCEAFHLKSMDILKPLIPTTQFGNKFVSPWPTLESY